jgi:hypothetical protein
MLPCGGSNQENWRRKVRLFCFIASLVWLFEGSGLFFSRYSKWREKIIGLVMGTGAAVLFALATH